MLAICPLAKREGWRSFAPIRMQLRWQSTGPCCNLPLFDRKDSMMTNDNGEQPVCRTSALRQLANQWQEDLNTLDAMGLHLAAARLDGALSSVKRTLDG